MLGNPRRTGASFVQPHKPHYVKPGRGGEVTLMLATVRFLWLAAVLGFARVGLRSPCHSIRSKLMSPSNSAVRNRQLSLALDAAKKRGDIAEMPRLLGELTALMQSQFGYPQKTALSPYMLGVSAKFKTLVHFVKTHISSEIGLPQS